jgi:hypothetical protein
MFGEPDHVEYADAMIAIGEARAEFIAWHAALTQLADDLGGELGEFEPTAPAISARPWIDGVPAAPAVWHVGEASPMILPESPQRYAPKRGQRRTGRTLTIEEMAVLRG